MSLTINAIGDSCELGEGVFYCKLSNRLFWVDIIKKRLYCYKDEKYRSWALPEMASCIFSVSESKVVLAAESGICLFDYDNDVWVTITPSPKKYLVKEYRANDGIILPNGSYLYGIMRKQPEAKDGALILSTGSGAAVLNENISIPNSFIVLGNQNNEILISDSYEKVTYKFVFNSSWDKVTDISKWKDFSDHKYTPDGGCTDKDGFVYIAMWGGEVIHKFTSEGQLIDEIPVDILYPTNCVFDQINNKLFVTSARVGISQKILASSPNSGKTLILNCE